MSKQRKQGFTAIEITMVVAVVGLLASMGTYAVLRAVNSSRIANAEIELEMLSAATLQLAWDTGKMPNGQYRNNLGSIEIWDLTASGTGLMDDTSDWDDWKGPYYDGATVDPWGNNYFFDPDYYIDGQVRVVVGSFGPNGQGRNQYDSDDIVVLLDD